MIDQHRAMSGALGADAYRDFEQHSAQALRVANPSGDWPFSDLDSALARRIVAGEYIGRHEGELDTDGAPSGPARYAKPGAAVIDLLKRRHLRLAQQRILSAVRRSQP